MKKAEIQKYDRSSDGDQGLWPFGAGGWRGWLLLSAFYFLGYSLLELISSPLEVASGVRLWIPSSGLSLALVLVAGVRLTPAILLVSWLVGMAGLSQPFEPYPAAVQSAGFSLIFALGSLISGTRRRAESYFQNLNDLMALVSLAGATALVLAFFESCVRAFASREIPAAEILHSTLTAWLAYSISLIVVTPLCLLVVIPRLRQIVFGRPEEPLLPKVKTPHYLGETVFQFITLAAVIWIVFVQDRPSLQAPPAFLCFLPVVWMALRRGLSSAIAVSFLLNMAAMFSTSGIVETDLADTQMLMLSVSLTGLFMGAVVTQRQLAISQLEVEKAHFEQLFESAPEAIVVVDNKSRILRANAEFTRMFQYSLEEALGQRVDHLIVPEDLRDEALTVTGKIMAEESVSLETVRRRKDGVLLSVSILGTPISVDGGRIAVYGIYRDITSRRELEEQLRQSQKMEAVGRLAGGVAHDFNNLLTAILGYSELLMDPSVSGGKTTHYIDEIRRAANRAKSLTSQLLAFSRKQILTPKLIALAEIIDNIEPMLSRLLGEQIQLETVIDKTKGRIKADPGQIEQVIVNLSVNARDAMVDGGRIAIEVSEMHLPEDFFKNQRTLPGDYVVLRFADTGCGMGSDVRKRIFEPFFTTKEQGKGTGLGLATVYGIVKQSGGLIDVESAQGKGTTFKIYFPKATEQDQAPVSVQDISRSLAESQTILLVEDDQAIRSLIVDILRENGFQVLEARRGSHALMMAEAYGRPIHLLLADVVMPEMSGRELAERLTVERPSIRILFMSGYSDDAILEHGVASKDSTFIQKPFTPEALLGKVREVLRSRDLPSSVQ